MRRVGAAGALIPPVAVLVLVLVCRGLRAIGHRP
jgi:hypothetical protein